MEPRFPRGGQTPESQVKRRLIEMLERRHWYVIVTVGSEKQKGLPDLYCAHINHGQRWLEVKHADGYHFTPAQLDVFPRFREHGVGVWVIACSIPVSEHELEYEYKKLMLEPNWHKYLGHSTKRAAGQ